MSAVDSVTVVAAAEPKVKKPTLPAKFAKFMQFGYFFVSSVKSAGLLDETVSNDLLERLCVFASVDDQKAFYEGWLASAKDSNKALRKLVSAHLKANSTPKPRAPRAKKPLDPNATPKTRKPRSNKNKSNDNDLINELQSLTQTSTNAPTESDTTLPVPEVSPPKLKKDAKIPKSKAKKDAAEPNAKKEAKPKEAPAEPKTPVVVATKPEENEDEGDLDVREFVYDGKTYLIDDSTGNVFDTESHDHIGVFSTDKNKLVFL